MTYISFQKPINPPHRKDGLVLCHLTRQTIQSTLWYCSQFLTVIFFVAILPKHLAHYLFRLATQPKSQANTQHSNKKTLHSNLHHRSAYASIKNCLKLNNIMWHYVFATHSLFPSLMQASIRTGCHIITLY